MITIQDLIQCSRLPEHLGDVVRRELVTPGRTEASEAGLSDYRAVSAVGLWMVHANRLQLPLVRALAVALQLIGDSRQSEGSFQIVLIDGLWLRTVSNAAPSRWLNLGTMRDAEEIPATSIEQLTLNVDNAAGMLRTVAEKFKLARESGEKPVS